MRIIGGKLKGRRLSAPTSITARPTTDRAKEGMFNLLQAYDFSQMRCLDLFAGIGSITLELESRGCKDVTCVENNENQLKFLHRLKQDLDLNFHICGKDVFQFLKTEHMAYDFIFADPPYELPAVIELPNRILELKMLSEKGIFILEHKSQISFEEHPALLRQKSYGKSNFSIFG